MDQVIAEWRTNWRIVVCALAGVITSIAHIFSLGVLLPHISRETGWSRAEASTGMLICSIVVALVAPFAGRLIDRGHMRACAIGGMALYCLAMVGLGWLHVALPVWLGIWAVLAMGTGASNLTIWTTAITRNFVASRGLTLAIVMCGSGVATAIFPVIGSTLAEHYGWRQAYVMLGLGIAAVCLPLFAAWLHDVPPAPEEQDRPAAPAATGSLYLTPSFLKLAGLSLVLTIALTGTTIHFPLILAETGITPTEAGRIAGLVGFGAIAGRLVIGALLDRANAAVVGAVGMLAPLAAMWLLFQASPGWSGIAAALLLGIGMGCEVMLIAYVAGRLYPTETFGSVWGVLIACLSISSGVGPVIAARIFDTWGNYSAFIVANAVILVLAMVTFLSLSRALGTRQA